MPKLYKFLRLSTIVLALLLASQAASAASWKIEQDSDAAGPYTIYAQKGSFVLEVKKLNVLMFDGGHNDIVVLDKHTKSYTSTPVADFYGLDQGRIMESALRELRDGKLVGTSPATYQKWKAVAFITTSHGGADERPCLVKTICLDDATISPACMKVVCLLNLIPTFDRLPVDCRRQDGFPRPRLVTTKIIDTDDAPLPRPTLEKCKRVKKLPSFSVTTDPAYIKDMFGF